MIRDVQAGIIKDRMNKGFQEHPSTNSMGRSMVTRLDHLSNRELQIAMMVVDCQRVQKIATDLHLSPKTVNSYRYRIFDKLKVRSDVELALLAARYGMIDVDTARLQA